MPIYTHIQTYTHTYMHTYIHTSYKSFFQDFRLFLGGVFSPRWKLVTIWSLLDFEYICSTLSFIFIVVLQEILLPLSQLYSNIMCIQHSVGGGCPFPGEREKRWGFSYVRNMDFRICPSEMFLPLLQIYVGSTRHPIHLPWELEIYFFSSLPPAALVHQCSQFIIFLSFTLKIKYFGP